MSAVRMEYRQDFVVQRDLSGFFYHGMLAKIQEKQKVSEIENNRTGAILNVPTPMGHLAKIKILECGTIGWQAGG